MPILLTKTEQKIRDLALSKLGCGYIYGATGWVCTPARRQQQATKYPQYTDNILGIGKKWDGKVCYDCAQLTKAAATAGNITLPSGATSQWNSNVWKKKGIIAEMPERICFVFRQSGTSMQHTGLYIGDGEVVEARGTDRGVIISAFSSYPWTHYALPAYSDATTVSDIPAMPSLTENALYDAEVINVKEGLNFRTSPINVTNTIMLLLLGSVVEVLQENCGNGFSKVRYQGIVGYCTRNYLYKLDN